MTTLVNSNREPPIQFHSIRPNFKASVFSNVSVRISISKQYIVFVDLHVHLRFAYIQSNPDVAFPPRRYEHLTQCTYTVYVGNICIIWRGDNIAIPVNYLNICLSTLHLFRLCQNMHMLQASWWCRFNHFLFAITCEYYLYIKRKCDFCHVLWFIVRFRNTAGSNGQRTISRGKSRTISYFF